ncbi:hypothetical protein NC652_018183 [Populus alba x Populus x berolinensis]|nr:hypothetical protein NC652_018183 [Populus alba x Populus x berolinensis]
MLESVPAFTDLCTPRVVLELDMQFLPLGLSVGFANLFCGLVSSSSSA